MRLFVFACLLASGTAFANGRAPGTSTINFERGNESHIAAGMTFGVVVSNDNGATWNWMCEEAVGYGGNYDPDYAFASATGLFATTFDGLKVNRDGCSYTRTVLTPTTAPTSGTKCDPMDAQTCPSGFNCAKDGLCERLQFFSAVAVSKATGAVFAAAANGSTAPIPDDKIYKSTDDGMTFPVSAVPAGAQIDDWYQSIEVAPSDGTVIYVAGYRLKAGQPKTFLMWRSSNGGTSYLALPVTDIATMPNSTIEIAAISKTDPNIVYARVVLSDNSMSDAIWRSIDGGQNWSKIIEKTGSISFVARANGELVAGTQALGTFKATETGTATLPTFTELTGAPHINCLGENSAGEVWACTQNYGSMTQPSDMFGIMKTTDLATWTGVLKFQDLKDPVSCATGTPQKDRCDVELWCGLCAQLGCNANRNCAVSDGPPQNDGTPTKPKTCCQAGSDDIPTLMLIALALGMICLRRRRA